MGLRTTQFPCNLDQLDAVRQFVDQIAPDPFKEEMELAIGEAFTNIVKHSNSPGDVILEVKTSEEGIVFILKDQGQGFDPSKIRPPDFSGERACGFGLYIIEQVADKIVYIPKPSADGWNELQIYRRMSWS